MQNISSKTANVAELPLKMNLQLFADGTPDLESTPEFQEDMREYAAMNAKMENFVAERTKEPEVKEEPVKEEVKAVTEEVATPDQKPKQSPEDNKAFQEMRRAQEAAETRAKRADALIAAQFGNQGITTVEQYEKWIEDGKREEEETRYKEAGLTPDEIQKLRDYDRIKAETSQEAQVKQQQEYQSQWQSLYATYPELVESSKAFNDGKDPEWFTDEMKAEIARGASPIAAYRNAHFESILQSKIGNVKEIAKQEALDKINSKEHLAPNGSAGGDIDHVEIDEEQMRMFRQLTSKKTDAQIRAWYKKNSGK